MGRQYGQKPQKLSLDGARVRVQYQRNGQAFEEVIALGGGLQRIDGCGTLYRSPPRSGACCNARSVVITRAAQGHLGELAAQVRIQEHG